MACRFCDAPSRPRDYSSSYCSVGCQIFANCSGTEHRDGCWVWAGAVRPKSGYGIIRVLIDGEYRNRSPARVAYVEFKGDVPYGVDVLNICKTQNCCNPRHLILGVQALPLRQAQDAII
jgi:hypothetical protein